MWKARLSGEGKLSSVHPFGTHDEDDTQESTNTPAQHNTHTPTQTHARTHTHTLAAMSPSSHEVSMLFALNSGVSSS